MKTFPNFRPLTGEILKKQANLYPPSLLKKAERLKAVFFDVDGVLTDGKIIYDETGKELKQFHVRDGAIVGYLRKAGIVTGIISGRESNAVSKRSAELRIDFCHQGIVDKADTFSRMAEHYKIKEKEIAYIGDDIADLVVFERAGLTVCPADAPPYIQSAVDYVTKKKGGAGVLREVGDLVLQARGQLKF